MLESDNTPAYLLGKTPEYIYLKQIFRFPSNGHTEIEPGKSVIVTNSAFNHSENNEIDLSDADLKQKIIKAVLKITPKHLP